MSLHFNCPGVLEQKEDSRRDRESFLGKNSSRCIGIQGRGHSCALRSSGCKVHLTSLLLVLLSSASVAALLREQIDTSSRVVHEYHGQGHHLKCCLPVVKYFRSHSESEARLNGKWPRGKKSKHVNLVIERHMNGGNEEKWCTQRDRDVLKPVKPSRIKVVEFGYKSAKRN